MWWTVANEVNVTSASLLKSAPNWVHTEAIYLFGSDKSQEKANNGKKKTEAFEAKTQSFPFWWLSW